jgi:hypothetical protein
MNGIDYAAYEAKCVAARALATEARPANKAALFDALAAAGIRSVTVSFDGAGDSGQIESITCLDGDNAGTALPGGTIDIQQVDFETPLVVTEHASVRDVIENMVYDFLEETHSGWEDGDGAYGEFTFSVTDRSITLDYNERYVETHYHEHEF